MLQNLLFGYDSDLENVVVGEFSIADSKSNDFFYTVYLLQIFLRFNLFFILKIFLRYSSP